MKKISIVFVCHGNICRSPMAEFVFKDIVEKNDCGHCFDISSAATSLEEIGNPVHYGTRRILNANGISCEGKFASQLTAQQMKDVDFLFVMDDRNINGLFRLARAHGEEFVQLAQRKTYKLLEYTGIGGDVEDPWYTGDFSATWSDISRSCAVLFDMLRKELND